MEVSHIANAGGVLQVRRIAAVTALRLAWPGVGREGQGESSGTMTRLERQKTRGMQS